MPLVSSVCLSSSKSVVKVTDDMICDTQMCVLYVENQNISSGEIAGNYRVTNILMAITIIRYTTMSWTHGLQKICPPVIFLAKTTIIYLFIWIYL